MVAIVVRFSIVALVLAGCIESTLVPCADGRACPAGTACDEVHRTCVQPDQITACNGRAELEQCAATTVDNGRCFAGVCLPAGCGNGELEPEERCDDGNTVAGDGCAADCLSNETCGDGFVDRNRGEECDDGNSRGRDGCTAACTQERLLWRRAAVAPAARIRAGTIYDAARARLVMFGGFGQSISDRYNDTWEWSGSGWMEVTPDVSPSARLGFSMAFDTGSRRVVVFGGTNLGTLNALNDTWEWDGATWRRATPLLSPPARTSAAMTWDPIRKRLVLFGGSSSVVARFGDTWVWDGATWLQVASSGPAARTGAHLVYDASRGAAVLHGGTDAGGVALRDVWLFDGAQWSELVTTGLPDMFIASGLAYDAARGVVVAVGSVSGAHVTVELSGATWEERTPLTTTPSIASFFATAYDTNRRRVVQFGGRGFLTVSNAVWEWDGVDWALNAPAAAPAARHGAAAAFDPLRGRVTLFGGAVVGGAVTRDTWEWDGDGWIQPSPPSVQPGGCVSPAMAFDPISRRVLLFGGTNGLVDVAETWSWDGVEWTELAVSSSPAPRSSAAMTTTASGTLLFGGTDLSTGAVFGDTWSWNGSQWLELSPAVSPSPRHGSALAYDVSRRRVVLYGGRDASGDLGDTWEWDGQAWNAIVTPVTPGARFEHVLVYDARRHRVMLFGGVDATVWEWDGVQWLQPSASGTPSPRSTMAAAYDAARGETIAFGGRFGSSSLPNAFALAYRGGVDEVCRTASDLDGDGLASCDDDDCSAVCAPLCAGDPCDGGLPSCGDGTCSGVEDGYACPLDCATPAPICGDAYCAAGEACVADC